MLALSLMWFEVNQAPTRSQLLVVTPSLLRRFMASRDTFDETYSLLDLLEHQPPAGGEVTHLAMTLA
jgi:hypothetical protein